MTEAEERLLDGVRSWLERGGYVLELEAARVITRTDGVLAMNLRQGYYFVDPITGKDREGDIRSEIVVHVPEHLHGIDLIVECKDTTAPWVFFVGDEPSPVEPWRAVRNADTVTCPHCLIALDRVGYGRASAPDAYAVTEKRANQKDHAYEAVQQAAAALIAAFPAVSEESHNGVPMFGQALVVTRSPLVICTLGNNATVNLRITDSASVLVPRSNLPGDQRSAAVRVCVVQLAALEGFLATLSAKPTDQEVDAATAEIEEFHGRHRPS